MIQASSGTAQFEEIVRAHQAMVFRMLVRLTGTREHVDDLAQDVFLRLHRALPSFRGEALLTTYLHRIVLNVAQDEWKRRKRDERATSLSDDTSGWADRLAHPEPNAEQQIATRELQARVDRELGRSAPSNATSLCFTTRKSEAISRSRRRSGSPSAPCAPICTAAATN